MNASAIVPASQLFAWEMSYASPIHGANGRCRTPFGVHSKEIAYIGTLTETITSGDKIVALRMSDPTGICTVNLDPRAEGLYEKAEELDVPSFVYIFGTIRTRNSGVPADPEISATVIKPVSRDARNSWILQTAYDTACRLEKLEPTGKIHEFQTIIKNAITTVKPPEKKQAITDEEVLDLIHSLYEGRSAPRDKVLEGLKEKGMTKQQAVETIARLMEEGECYAPKPDIIKLA